MKKILLLVSFLLAISNMAFSQINSEVLTYVEGRYYYQNRIYKHKKLSPLLEVNPKAHKIYKEYLRSRRVGSALMALAIVGGSVLVIKGDPCKDAFDRDECDLLFTLGQLVGGMAVFGSVVTAIYSSTEDSRRNKKIKRAVKIFNEDLAPPVGVSPFELNLKTTNNGVGLVLNF